MNKESDKHIEEFKQELTNLIKKYVDEEKIDLHISMIEILFEARHLACCVHSCFTHALGELADIITSEFREQFEEIQNLKKEDENASCTM